MRRIIAFEFLSLDGFMAGPRGEEMDFVTSSFNQEMEKDLAVQYEEIDAFVMGKTTFQSLAAYWPTASSKDELLRGYMNSYEKLVFSTTMDDVSAWSNSRLLGPDAESQIKQIKERPGKDIMIIGSASLVQAFSKRQLIDEFRFFLFPVVLGAGKPLFAHQEKAIHLDTLHTKHFDTGVVRVDYARA